MWLKLYLYASFYLTNSCEYIVHKLARLNPLRWATDITIFSYLVFKNFFSMYIMSHIHTFYKIMNKYLECLNVFLYSFIDVTGKSTDFSATLSSPLVSRVVVQDNSYIWHDVIMQIWNLDCYLGVH